MQARGFVEARPVLGRPQLDVLVAVARGVPEEPSAVAVPGHGNSPPHEIVQAGCRQVDVAHQDHLRRLFQPGGRHLLVIDRHDQGFAGLRNFRLSGLDVERQRIGAGDSNRTRGDVGPGEAVDFIRQADLDQRAARTLRTVFERRRDDPGRGDAPQTVDRLERGGYELFVERHAHAFAAAGEVEHPFDAVVAMLAQHEALHAKLHPLGIVRAPLGMWPLAALVVDGRHPSAVRFDEVHPGDQPEAV